jgi:hypothetical protein
VREYVGHWSYEHERCVDDRDLCDDDEWVCYAELLALSEGLLDTDYCFGYFCFCCLKVEEERLVKGVFGMYVFR